MGNHQKLFRAIYIAAALVWLPAGLYDAFLDNTYVNRPRESRPESGLIVPYHVKGITVYITNGERHFMTWLNRFEILAGVVFLAGFVASGDVLRKLRGESLRS